MVILKRAFSFDMGNICGWQNSATIDYLYTTMAPQHAVVIRQLLLYATVNIVLNSVLFSSNLDDYDFRRL